MQVKSKAVKDLALRYVKQRLISPRNVGLAAIDLKGELIGLTTAIRHLSVCAMAWHPASSHARPFPLTPPFEPHLSNGGGIRGCDLLRWRYGHEKKHLALPTLTVLSSSKGRDY